MDIGRIIDDLASWQFGLGVIVGYVGRWTLCWARARWLDKHRPRRDGTRHPVPSPNRYYIGLLLALATIGWSLYQIDEQSHRTDQVVAEAHAFAVQVQECQREFNTALRERSRITMENDQQSVNQRTALASWLRDLLFPPEPYASMDREDPRYKDWAINLTGGYYEQIAAAQKEQDRLAEERRDHPLPEPTCGN
jgi:hypothetical protein